MTERMLYYAPWDASLRFPIDVIYPRIAICRHAGLPPTATPELYTAALAKLDENLTAEAMREWASMTNWRMTGPNDGQALLPAMQSGMYEYLFLLGGRAGAKSHEAAEAIIELTSKQPKRVVCGREFQTSIRDSSHALLKAKIKAHPSANEWTITDHELKHSNGTLITFIGLARNPESAKSLEGADIFWGEEAQTFSAASMEILIPTIREAGSMLIFTLNPRYADDPVYTLAMVDRPELAFVKVSAFEDNPYLFTSRLVNDLRKSFRSSKRFRHVWRGDLDRNSELRIIHHHVGRPPVSPYNRGKTFYGVDFGETDPTAVVRVTYYSPEALNRDPDDRGALYIDREFCSPCKSNRDIVFGVSETCPELLEGRYMLKADSADPKAIEELNSAGIPTIGAVKGAGSVLGGIRTLADHDVYVSEDCPITIKAAENYRWKADRLGKPTNVPEHAHSHIFDACRYAIEDEDLSAGGGVYYLNLEEVPQ